MGVIVSELNHSKGLFFNALDRLSECQYNIPFMFKSGRTFQMVGWTYPVKRRQIKRRGKNDGGKIGRKERKKSEEKKKKRKKKKEKSQNKRKEREKEGGKR